MMLIKLIFCHDAALMRRIHEQTVDTSIVVNDLDTRSEQIHRSDAAVERAHIDEAEVAFAQTIILFVFSDLQQNDFSSSALIQMLTKNVSSAQTRQQRSLLIFERATHMHSVRAREQ